MPITRSRAVVVGLVTVMTLTGCAGGDEAGRPAGDVDEASGSQATPTVAEVQDTEDTEPIETASPDADDPQTTSEAGTGSATVQVDGETFTFRVIQCLRDVPGPMGGTVAFQLDGVPPDTPADLIGPLMGPVDPDADVQGRLAPVFDVGPILSVSRVTDGGDFVAISTGPGDAYVTTANATSAAERYLEISDAPSGATVQGASEAMTPSGTTAQMSLDGVCP